LKNYYQILGLEQSSTAQEIKAAYRELAKLYHPDRNAGSRISEESFKLIQEAYAVLADTNSRYLYDVSLREKDAPKNTSKQPVDHRYRRGGTVNARSNYMDGRSKQARRRKQLAAYKKKVSIIFLSAFALLIALALWVGPMIKNDPFQPSGSMQASFTTDIGNASTEYTANVPEEHDDTLISGFAPYDHLFPAYAYDENSQNNITIYNPDSLDVVVCVVNKKTGQTARNAYIRASENFSIYRLPNGNYYLKAYFGQHPIIRKTNEISKQPILLFKDLGRYYSYNLQENIIELKQQTIGQNTRASSYFIRLDPSDKNPHAIGSSFLEFFGDKPQQ
jgi:hypothetical protein